MADLTIKVVNDGGRTVSQFSADKIWFVNGDAAELTIGFKPGQSENLAFCKNKNDDHTKGDTSLTIGGNDKKGVYICKDFPGTSFGYTAQITNTVLEDPIIIIQKDTYSGYITANLPGLATAFLLGAAVTLLARRLFVKSRPT